MFHYSYLLKDQPIQISLNEVFSGEFGTTTWPSSAQLAKVIFRNESAFDNKVVLELGCGSGLSGIAAAKCGSTVYLTDLSEPSSILANCKENCAINHVEDRTLIWPLHWGHVTKAFFDLPPIDIVIGADLFYDTKLLDSCLCTLSLIKECNPSCKFLFLFPERVSIDTISKYFDLWEFAIDFQRIDFEESTHQMILGISPNFSTVYQQTLHPNPNSIHRTDSHSAQNHASSSA